MNKGCSPFTQIIGQVKIFCIFIIKGRAIRKLIRGGGGGGAKSKKIYSHRRKLNDKYSCTPSNAKNIHTKA